PTHPSSTRSKTSGNICAATSSPTRSTKITTISSKKPAKHGCSSPTTRSRSLQSPHANGQRSIFSAVGIRPHSLHGQRLGARLFHEPPVIGRVEAFHRQYHDRRRGIAVQFLYRRRDLLGQRGAGLDDHHHFLGPLDFALPPVVRDHPRRDNDA